MTGAHHWGAERTFKSHTASIEVLPDISAHGIISSLEVLNVVAANLDDLTELVLLAESYIGKSETVWSKLPTVVMKPEYPSRAYFLESQGLPSTCDAVQFSDIVVCGCGRTWDTNDPSPPICPKKVGKASQNELKDTLNSAKWPPPNSVKATLEKKIRQAPSEYRSAVAAARAAGIAVQAKSDKEVGQAQRRLSRLYGEPVGPLASALDSLGKWFVGIVLILATTWLIWAHFTGGF